MSSSPYEGESKPGRPHPSSPRSAAVERRHSTAQPGDAASRQKRGAPGGTASKLGTWIRSALLVAPLVVLGYVVFTRAPDPVGSGGASLPAADEDTLVKSPLSDADLPRVAEIMVALWNGTAVADLGPVPARLQERAQPIYLAARHDGVRRQRRWQNGKGTVVEALAAGIGRLRQQLGAKASEIDALSVDLSHSFRTVEFQYLRSKPFRRSHRGVFGVEIRRGDDVLRYGPSRVIDSNRGPNRMREVFRDRYDLTDEQSQDDEVTFRVFRADELLVKLGTTPRAKRLFRGNEVVDVSAVSAASLGRWADLAIDWLRNNVHDDGRLTYLYWPSPMREAPPTKNNMIRQWMATVALGRWAADRNDAMTWDLSERNIDYNLAKFYREQDGLGMIERLGKVKLGAMALATLAIVEHKNRAKWAGQEAALRRSIDSLWHDDGSFTTFLKPEGRNDNTNFYPGEALLLWAVLYDQQPDPALLERFMRSFRYYRAWHLDENNRNPAFIPWHTQAYYLVWTHTQDEKLRDFVFEMNDWLLGVQQWDDANHPDERGRFYARDRGFGPPHASSTGVYIEGLIDAFRLARAVGDDKRAEAYRLALVRGMRSQLQLQFADEVDLSYVAADQRHRVRGGIRTTTYDNSIRCDNVQHPLMGILKVLRTFQDSDYQHP
ncbi:MAG: hypothetical protein B7733_03370 [Myxococcales bacterium FL481]|nr:MAG: hypothetical protein B7733_03370 [Myxococcales bacterium FL481]